jgi:serine/threonine protein kinase/uncharacterized protein YecT (DUF1311 family)
MNVRSETLCPGCFEDKAAQAVCPHCGYDESEHRGPLVLPHRTLLQGQYLIGRVLGKPGGFGMTYLAFDTRLETRVAIKEYLPRDLAGREAGQITIGAHSREDAELFRYGLEQFLHEARTLAKFDHAHVVRVRHVFEENGTAYLVMDYYEGLTLAEYLHRNGRIPERTALDILMPILDGLREVHGKGFIHRDIKPQNIYLTRQGRPILLDFGTARLAMAERSRSLSVVLTPGYAPFEQYHRKGEQGPWTDVYACAAVLYQMVTGEVPPEAAERTDEDPLVAPRSLVPDLSPRISEAILHGMAMDYRRRPQTIAAFQDRLHGEAVAPPKPRREAGRIPPEAPAPPPGSRTPRSSWPWVVALAGILVAAGGYYETQRRAGDERRSEAMERRMEAERRAYEAEQRAREVARDAEAARQSEAARHAAAEAERRAEEAEQRAAEAERAAELARSAEAARRTESPARPSSGVSPSFDCRKASTFVEREICRDAVLAGLDGELGRAYRMARNALTDSAWKRLRQEQIAWLRQRDGYLTQYCIAGGHIDASCARPYWEQRIAQVRAWAE